MVVLRRDGTLVVPVRVEFAGGVGDATRLIRPDSPEHQRWLRFAVRP